MSAWPSAGVCQHLGMLIAVCLLPRTEGLFGRHRSIQAHFLSVNSGSENQAVCKKHIRTYPNEVWDCAWDRWEKLPSCCCWLCLELVGHLNGFHFMAEVVKKNPPANSGDARDVGSVPGLERSPGVGNGNPLQYFLPGKFHGQRNLVGYSPRGRKNSDMREHTLIHIVALQCYVNFFCIAKWIHSTYTHTPSVFGILSRLGRHGAHRRVLWAIEWRVKKPLSPVQLCNPMEYSLPGSSVHGILQARLLEWVAVPFSRGLPDPGIEPRSLPRCRQIL